MKKQCIAVLLALGLCSNVLAVTYLGPPTTRMQAGQLLVGASYADSTQDLEFTDGFDLEDTDARLILGRLGVGLVTERAELFGLAGAVQLEQDDFDTGNEFLFGAGTRLTMQRGTDLDWGLVGQVTYFQTDGHSTVLSTFTGHDLTVAEAQVAIGPCWRPGNFMLYGGPMLDWIDGEIDTNLVGNHDIRQSSMFGGYFGGGFQVTEQFSITAEFQATGHAHGWGICGEWRF